MLLIGLTGCSEQRILDEQQLLFAVGYDLVEENLIEGTVLIPIYKTEEEVESVTLSATATTSRDIRSLLEAKSSKPLFVGKIMSVLFDYQLAEQGILPITDTFLRDPRIGMRIFFVTVDKGTTKELLSVEYDIADDTGTYLKQLIEQNIERQTIPQSNFYTFISDFFQDGKDPLLPNLKLQGKQMTVSGLTLFKDDKAVHKINLRDSFLMKLLLEPAKEGTYELALDKESDEYAVVRNIRSKNSFKVDLSQSLPTIDVTIELNGIINEYSGHTLNEEKIEEIKNLLQNTISNEMNSLISVLQEKNIDPVGFGAKVKAKDPSFDVEEWEEQYPDVPINLHLEVVITETGVEE